jgi:UDP-glucose 4-epimerase
MQTLVTGGAGFIGSHLAEALCQAGHAVRVADNLSTGRLENLAGLGSRVDFLQGDLLEPSVRERALRGVEVVFHEAAIPSVPRSIEDPLASHAHGAQLTLLLLDGARRAGVRRFILAGSSSIYGNVRALPTPEDHPPEPLSPYAATKLASECYAQTFARCFELDTVVLRYFNVFGPRQDPTSEYSAVIPLFVTKVLRGERPTIFGDGEQSRDFIHVDDVVRANLLAAGSAAAAGEAFNIACGIGTTVNGLLAAVNEVLGTKIEARYAPPRPGDILHSTADIAKARRLTGFAPGLSFRDGLRATVEWYKKRS